MGRQSAGKAFMRGIARKWPHGSTLHGVGLRDADARKMIDQLKGDGFVGRLTWSIPPNWSHASQVGAIYYPCPLSKDIAHARNSVNSAAFSLMGITHTLSEAGAMDDIAALVLPPFKPWDALICTSQAALGLVNGLQRDVRAWWSEHTGLKQFVDVALPVIPLGIDCPAFAPNAAERAIARTNLEIGEQTTLFLSAGRLSIHAKANPAVLYQALEQIAQTKQVACIEAGIFANEETRRYFHDARKALAPSVQFLWADGNDEIAFRQAWQGADVFVSLSDNIQETFGLTPVEAMAAGLPVVVSDWNGYKDSVRHGVEGFRIPTVLPPPGTGEDIAFRYALGIDESEYDVYIGRISLATTVDQHALASALFQLASMPELRVNMGKAGIRRARQVYDWPIILGRYVELAKELEKIRVAVPVRPSETWPTRADPFLRFSHFSTHTLRGDWIVSANPGADVRLQELLGLRLANYALDSTMFSAQEPVQLTTLLVNSGSQTVNNLLSAAGMATPQGIRALMWLWKFSIVGISPTPFFV